MNYNYVRFGVTLVIVLAAVLTINWHLTRATSSYTCSDWEVSQVYPYPTRSCLSSNGGWEVIATTRENVASELLVRGINERNLDRAILAANQMCGLEIERAEIASMAKADQHAVFEYGEEDRPFRYFALSTLDESCKPDLVEQELVVGEE